MPYSNPISIRSRPTRSPILRNMFQDAYTGWLEIYQEAA
jgi:hypothetical protein